MLRIVQVGLGPLGQKVVRFTLERGGMRIVAAVDPDPAKAGKDLGEVCSIGPLGLTVGSDCKTALKRRNADVAVLTTVSGLNAAEPQIKTLAEAGLHIVSTCEELSFPWRTHPRIARRLDRLCRECGVACVGTGVNPGFLMDFLPGILSSVCQKINKVKVTRIQDASKRRIPFQQKIGAGLTRTQFKAKAADGSLRHVGLVESAHMIAHGLNWRLDRTTESLKPVMAKTTINSGYKKIVPGLACGVEQVCRGFRADKEVIRLHFRAAVGEKDSFDLIEIDGTPSLSSKIAGGVNGDVATCAIVINAARSITKVGPGLKTMLDLPAPTYFDGN